MTPRELAGALLVAGFSGTSLAPRTAAALERGERAGVILFRRNLPDVAALVRIAEQTRAASLVHRSAVPLVAIDEEGGRVSRLPAPEIKLPPMRRVGTLGSADLARRAGLAVGARLAALGVNLDFAPVLDVDSNPMNPVIGDRSFSSEPEACARLGLAFADGLRAGGVLPCGKHFPGHGDTDKDSHHDLPVLSHDRARLDAVELAPFREAARAGLETIMSAHVVIRALDEDRPATLSRRVMTELLRTEIGFGGVLVSDDLEMRAVADRYPIDERTIGAVTAGCDALLICSDEDLADAAHAALTAEIESSAAFAARCREAASRMAALRRRAASLHEARAARAPSIADVVLEIEKAERARGAS